MSQNMLHIVAANRMNNTSVIVGDRGALACLRDAIEQAFICGSGGARLLASDGEPHNIAVVFENDMYPVYTSYAYEAAPARSRRETVPIERLRHYPAALGKATGTIAPDYESEAALATPGAK